jgi:hypothetical protein
MAELQQLMLAEIRTHEGCEDVTDVSIYHVTDGRAENNWEGGVVGCGSAAPDDASRAAAKAQQTLRRTTCSRIDSRRQAYRHPRSAVAPPT